MTTAVVYVHGLWMVGWEGALLRWRLARALQARTQAFRYRSVVTPLEENARALSDSLKRLPADCVHLVAHSLGGLIVLAMFEQGVEAWLAPGRVVLLGPPLRGSLAAQNLARSQFGKHILGKSLNQELRVRTPERLWQPGRELGVIAGDLSVGLGRLMGTGGVPSDGTVLVEETRLAGAAEHLILPVNHMAMPFSAAVARRTALFLQTGHF